MRGHIRERSPGRWAIVIEQRDPSSGQRKRRWHSFRGTKRQAQDECARLVTATNSGIRMDSANITLTEFLQGWLKHTISQVTPKSHERYSSLVNQNIIPALGPIRLAKLRPVHISNAYAAALKGGRRDGKEGA
jgi:hypothetical protein